MALRTIRVEDDPCLKKVCRPVEKYDERLAALIDDLYETMYKNDGAGLAAPQVGILRRIAVVDAGEQKFELVNPKIIRRSGCVGGFEGCLSFPGKSGYVERSERVVVEGYDRHGVLHRYDTEDFCARAVQHELDHLDGVVYLDIAIDPPEDLEQEQEE